ncbi:hypothetical protein [Saccharopolyspora shandongensis]|uniref:hypothetical protein n=1 Tax=Saccharopolyspora shandongensis TaxID=418495 RepID=UPI0033F6D762
MLDEREVHSGLVESIHDGEHLAAGDTERVPTTGLVEPSPDYLGNRRHCTVLSSAWSRKVDLDIGPSDL